MDRETQERNVEVVQCNHNETEKIIIVKIIQDYNYKKFRAQLCVVICVCATVRLHTADFNIVPHYKSYLYSIYCFHILYHSHSYHHLSVTVRVLTATCQQLTSNKYNNRQITTTTTTSRSRKKLFLTMNQICVFNLTNIIDYC